MLAIYLTGLVLIAAVSAAVAMPFFRATDEPLPEDAPPERERWRRRKDEALAGIREAEFDFHLGKLSEADYASLRRRLEAEAVEAIHALEGGAPRGHDR
jgi:hypothetical protein